ncbi:hypothetical protein [Litoribrevibacter albus]|uniref:Uncharacterized protein n=1 Tax=Litoribrevibacter albus TaxID=1473156 RepID=A0AA37SBS9_9GAMM|nr:hypothetical protein [Litoribrevibacter albus]GLQ31622.1 hypothetical protein GCM10007876_21010 [Litoribrevibacter albus]
MINNTALREAQRLIRNEPDRFICQNHPAVSNKVDYFLGYLAAMKKVASASKAKKTCANDSGPPGRLLTLTTLPNK